MSAVENIKPCSGCGAPTGGKCWTDCGMSLCGAPLCSNCCHVDEKYGWRHEPITMEQSNAKTAPEPEGGE